MFKIKSDHRITKIGRIIRKYSLDELPQLVNVVAGSMGLV
ncbi:sugar transferase [Paucilactobacillus suebicus]|nr:sugar transferase [Paucilactobacillus suebicus]